MSALPTRADLAGTPTRAELQTILLAMYDMVAQRLAAGTTDAGTASAAELLLARNSLGLGAGADIASAATIDITARTGNVVRITGTVETTALTMNNGDVVYLIAAGSWPINVAGVLTYTCTAEDVILVSQDDDGVQHASVFVDRPATTAEAQAGTNTSRSITPATLRSGLNASGSAPIYACRAWVNFNGTGTVAIRASGNVSSVTDNGTGDYTVNFTNALPDTNYAVAVSGQNAAPSYTIHATIGGAATYLTTSVRVIGASVTASANNPADLEVASVIVTR